MTWSTLVFTAPGSPSSTGRSTRRRRAGHDNVAAMMVQAGSVRDAPVKRPRSLIPASKTFLHPSLNWLRLAAMQEMICSLLGMYQKHSRIASPWQALRWTGVSMEACERRRDSEDRDHEPSEQNPHRATPWPSCSSPRGRPALSDSSPVTVYEVDHIRRSRPPPATRVRTQDLRGVDRAQRSSASRTAAASSERGRRAVDMIRSAYCVPRRLFVNSGSLMLLRSAGTPW